ncbi:MAG: D-2-hydroxyacid dehydrogenase [Deltaproteobacteria bacterium]|nr:MAG: D-2-hydroxyacid dehydrogenase [Deltaproteobacteria bacterium]
MIEVLNIQPLGEADLASIKVVDPSVNLTDAQGWFNGEICETWPPYVTRFYVGSDRIGKGTREERDAMLAKADVFLCGWPYPLDVRRRAPNLKWFHHFYAGANNLHRSDVWGSDVIVSTSRGAGNTLPIAEYVVAGILHFAKDFQRAWFDRDTGKFRRPSYAPLSIAGKTVCVVGVGGIGREVGRLCAALGMRVVGTRKQASGEGSTDLPEGFSDLRGPDGLNTLLSKSDFVAICCQLTKETEGLFDAAAFRAMKPGSVLVNIARGEIVEEASLIEALDADHLRGVVLDVYTGEFKHPPDERLWKHPQVLMTPHLSGGTDSFKSRALKLLCDNLKAFIEGRPMTNVIDWERGY